MRGNLGASFRNREPVLDKILARLPSTPALMLTGMIVALLIGTLGIGAIVVATAGLSSIEQGAQPPSPEWGAMLDASRAYLRTAWCMSFFPGAAIFVAVLSINLLNDGLREAIDPKVRH